MLNGYSSLQLPRNGAAATEKGTSVRSRADDFYAADGDWLLSTSTPAGQRLRYQPTVFRNPRPIVLDDDTFVALHADSAAALRR